MTFALKRFTWGGRLGPNGRAKGNIRKTKRWSPKQANWRYLLVTRSRHGLRVLPEHPLVEAMREFTDDLRVVDRDAVTRIYFNSDVALMAMRMSSHVNDVFRLYEFIDSE